MMPFYDFEVIDHTTQERWTASVTDFFDLGSFQRIIIEACGSRLDILCGQCPAYRWIFFPELEIGCMQASLDDFFWNTERLSRILNRKDSLTAVYGVYAVLSGGCPYA